MEHAIKYPEEARGCDYNVLAPLRERLRDCQGELAQRAGEPELMKTEAAERMRQKLEKRLLPKLKISVPLMAEKLRFLHMEVLKWQAPARSAAVVGQEAEARQAAERQVRPNALLCQLRSCDVGLKPEVRRCCVEQRAERQQLLQAQHAEQLAKEQALTELAPDENPVPDEEEMRVLESMGWGGATVEEMDPGGATIEEIPDGSGGPEPAPELCAEDRLRRAERRRPSRPDCVRC